MSEYDGDVVRHLLKNSIQLPEKLTVAKLLP
jgi:hypothetical protein